MALLNDSNAAITRLPQLLACPVCEQPFHATKINGLQLVCTAGHSFDIARQGYANLLLANQHKSATPGYTREMLLSRRAVMMAGLFDPLMVLGERGLTALTSQANVSHATFLDAGCGEGYLFSRLLRATRLRSCICVDGIGIDIAKPGIRIAASHDRAVAWCVANLTRRLPIMSGVIGIILNVLAPLNAAEFRRILCKDGVLLKVIPGKEHFRELRAALYEVDAPGPSLIGEVEAQLYPFFLVIEKQRLNWVWQVARVPLHDILTMGPLFWKAKKAKMKAMETTGLAQVTVDLELIIARAR